MAGEGRPQKGNTVNASVPASQAVIDANGEDITQTVNVADPEAPVRRIDAAALRNLGAKYKMLFEKFSSERLHAEQRWLRNLRQYLGIYDPDIERVLPRNRSRAYPRLTRVKCIAMLSRLMNLMFPGNEDNWELNASPSPEMSPEDVKAAVEELLAELQKTAPDTQLTQALLEEAVRRLADKQAAQLTSVVKDQLLELGGSQTIDWIALNRKVCDSGIKYGIGVLEGPYVREIKQSGWAVAANGTFEASERTIYKPQFDFLPVWDFYPDMSARELPGEGYFVRKILGRSAVRKLANRSDFFETQIKQMLLQYPTGNFRAKSWETDLKSMGMSVNAQEYRTEQREKYEVIIWKGPISAQTLVECGVTVPESMLTDDVDAELWMIDNWIIKAEINPWFKLGVPMRTAHIFEFDEDDTSPVGQGLPSIVRDSQLSIAAATRMALDNASVTCGPNLEVNTALARADQDLTAVEPYKIWYRDDDGPTSQFPAVRRIEIDGHLGELQGLMKMFFEIAEMETFIGPGTGGDMAKMPSEPMRTAAGASMLRGDAALPFKDIVRNYDSFTQSVIWAIVLFNRNFNPDLAPGGDYDVIARGATSLIAKEVRGMQIDQLAATLTPEDRDHVDERRFVEARFAARDLQGMLVSADEAKRRKDQKAQVAAAAAAKQDQMIEAQIREVASNAFKNIAQGQKNAANADQVGVKTALEMIDSEAVGDGQSESGGGTGGSAS